MNTAFTLTGLYLLNSMTLSLIFMIAWLLAFVVFAVKRGNMAPFLLGMMIGLVLILVLHIFVPFL